MKHQTSPWDEILGFYFCSPKVKLSELLSIVAESTRLLCATFPQNDCRNHLTDDAEVAHRVARHLAQCLTATPIDVDKQKGEK